MAFFRCTAFRAMHPGSTAGAAFTDSTMPPISSSGPGEGETNRRQGAGAKARANGGEWRGGAEEGGGANRDKRRGHGGARGARRTVRPLIPGGAVGAIGQSQVLAGAVHDTDGLHRGGGGGGGGGG